MIPESFNQQSFENFSKESSKLLNQSSVMFKSGRKCFSSATLLATLAIKVSPSGSSNVPIAYVNRSMPLMGLGRYEEGFDDLEMAKKWFLFGKKYVNLLFKQADCAIELKSRERLEQIIEELEKYDYALHNQKADSKKSKSFDKFSIRNYYLQFFFPPLTYAGMQTKTIVNLTIDFGGFI